ncbi:MAG TPA: hypothetical protein VK470_12200 [Bacteroidota bacterium]|nr:hypothetical protein [Bacteroidota bacterium]
MMTTTAIDRIWILSRHRVKYHRNIETSFSSFKRLARATFFFFALGSGAPEAEAAFERLAQPPSCIGRGHTGCAGSGADFTQVNPAALAACVRPHIALFHSPSPFEIPALSHSGISAALPFRFGTIQCTLTRSGMDLFREHTAMLTYAVALDPAISIGASYVYNTLSIEGYGSAQTSGVDLGISASPASGLTLGASVLNVNRPVIGAASDELPRVFILGMSYQLSSYACVSADMVKDVRFPESIHAGVEAAPLEFISIRAGTSTEPARIYGGLGIRAFAFEINYAIVTHQELGLTHTIGISFNP